MISIKNRFSQLETIDSFKRIDDQHVLDLYIGIDNLSRYTLFLISQSKPRYVFPSQIINVQVGKRHDDRWGLSFSLINNKFTDIFCCFCSDIIESSRGISDKEKGTEFICSRYIKWQEMLSRTSGEILSSSVVKGLVGELYFLKEYLIPTYGQEVAINSWIGPNKGDQDFVCKNTWYEVKSTVSGAESVKIASIEQLDTKVDGELIIVYLDKTSKEDSSKITLNRLYQEVLDFLETEDLKQIFSDTLLKLGYYRRHEYDDLAYKFSKFNRYKVDSNFPCVRRDKLPEAIANCKYDLSILAIGNFLKEEKCGIT